MPASRAQGHPAASMLLLLLLLGNDSRVVLHLSDHDLHPTARALDNKDSVGHLAPGARPQMHQAGDELLSLLVQLTVELICGLEWSAIWNFSSFLVWLGPSRTQACMALCSVRWSFYSTYTAVPWLSVRWQNLRCLPCNHRRLARRHVVVGPSPASATSRAISLVPSQGNAQQCVYISSVHAWTTDASSWSSISYGP